MSLHALSQFLASEYQPHALHGADRAWAETNCYIDVWVEILHAQGLNPLACLPMVFANDFDGDQWTFYKPPHEDLYALYGIDVQELNVWRGLLSNASTQLERGRLVLTETDSFYLPDTAGTDYRSNHVKTTIAIQEIDLENHKLGYFHNSSYHELQGEDFVETFRVDKPHDPAFMPLFAEFVRLDHVQHRTDAELAAISLPLLRKYLARRPRNNPVNCFQPVFLRDVEQLKEEGMAAYHAYAFACLRQLGAGFSLGAHYLRWLQQHQSLQFDAAAAEFEAISDLTKTLLLKTARAVMSKKAVDLAPLLEQLALHWQQGMDALDRSLVNG
ncbi:DUF1839 family protein [Undibacterium sp. Ji50W]|uniref:DUF1839 family protein n=1 Tax=Undibacterium sp. Ji50W TaxID=3413041 RepID=UPI003BF33A99